jgi:hypothetical protein
MTYDRIAVAKARYQRDFAMRYSFDESKHPRGNEKNAGQFSKSAHAKTLETGSNTPISREALDHSEKAVGYSEKGDSAKAAKFHKMASKVHWEQSLSPHLNPEQISSHQ